MPSLSNFLGVSSRASPGGVISGLASAVGRDGVRLILLTVILSPGSKSERGKDVEKADTAGGS